jgi:hypothetical protein
MARDIASIDKKFVKFRRIILYLSALVKESNNILTLNMKAQICFETTEITLRLVKYHIQEAVSLQGKHFLIVGFWNYFLWILPL